MYMCFNVDNNLYPKINNMSRVNRYRESLNRFIKDRSCLFDNKCIPNSDISSIIYNKIKESDLLLSIILLTIMNNQNKKNCKTIQGYYAAASIEAIKVLLDSKIMKDELIDSYGNENYNVMREYLIVTIQKSLSQNLDAVKDNYDSSIATTIIINTINTLNDALSFNKILSTTSFILSDKKPSSDIKRWYIKDDKSLDEKYNDIKVINDKSFKEYHDNNIECLCEVAFCFGWIIGCGDLKKIKKIKKIAKSFSYLYKLSHDFENIEEDIRNCTNGVSTNFILNYGLQNSYEIFMDNKYKFIEDAMLLDIFTSTIKEVVSYIETKVDNVIDVTSPDLRSDYSNVQSVSAFE